MIRPLLPPPLSALAPLYISIKKPHFSGDEYWYNHPIYLC